MPSAGRLAAALAMLLALVAGGRPAFAIPSPDLAVNFFASAAQIIGLATMVIGGALFGSRRTLGALKGRRARFGAPVWMLVGLLIFLVASVTGNILQWAGATDNDSRRLEANLVRPSVEAGRRVGDVTLKTLSFSEQIGHPSGITTDALAGILDNLDAPGAPDINLIDLREPEELEGGRLSSRFADIRYGDFPLVQDSLDLTGRTNVFLCYSGNRSSETCERLAALGIPCNFIVGGYEKWRAEGRPVILNGTESTGDLRALPSYANDNVLLDTPEVTDLARDEGAIFVDVRYPGDFELDHLPGAVNLPIRKMPTAEMDAAFEELPMRPIVAACYDKRSCFYSKILGLRLTRIGRDYRGRYTVPHEYFEPKAARAHVALWTEARNKSLLAIASEPLERLLGWIAQGSRSLPVAILIVVLLLRALISPFTVKAERDQIVQRDLAPEITWLKDRLAADKARLSRALMGLYRKNGLTPGLNMIGICIQIPLFLAFFFAVDAVAGIYDQGFWWLPSLAAPDPVLVLPVLIGALVFLHLYLAAARHKPLFTALRLAAGGFLVAITIPLGSAVNLYLVLSIALMLAQARAVNAFVDRRRDSRPIQLADRPSARRPAGNPRIIPLGEAGHSAVAGTKAARLGKMLEAGLPVPDGFVIASDAVKPDDDSVLTADDWRAVDALWPSLGAELVAVRSSGLNEDGEEHSYAGIFESILNVRRDALPGAIGAVRKSFRTDSAAQYGGRGDENGGILVQKMVDAEFAGVMFTEHPGESGCVLIEMVEGLGVTIADGTATPDAYRVGRRSGRLLGDIAPPVDLAPLVEFGRQLEALFAAPQDVEWAYRDGRYLILQSRNITALSRTQTANMTEFVHERERRRLLDLCGDAGPDEPVFVQNELSELLPRPTTFSLSFMEALWRPGGSTDLACRALRIPYNVEEDAPPFVNSAFGALYVNRREEKRRLGRGMGFLTTLRLTRMAERIERDFRDEFLPEFHHEIRVYEAVDMARLKTGELFDLLDHVCNRFISVNYVQAHMVNIAANYYFSLAERQLRKHGLSPAAHLGRMPETIVTRAMSMLSEIRNGQRAVESFLDLFGHRAPTDYEFADPRYMEDPALVERMIATASDFDASRHEQQTREALPDDRAVALCVERAGRFQELKEEAKHHCLRELAVIRRLLVELDGRLELGDGIFHIEYDEILRLRDEAFLHEARQLIARRRAESGILAAMRPPPAELTPFLLESMSLDGANPGLNGQTGDVCGNLVAGQAPIRGRARIVTTGDLDALEEGEILITRFIHPCWAPAFPRLTGVVTEVGGWLSHAAILAREYNIPTIVGARGVLNAVVTGDDVQLNPDGSIERL